MTIDLDRRSFNVAAFLWLSSLSNKNSGREQGLTVSQEAEETTQVAREIRNFKDEYPRIVGSDPQQGVLRIDTNRGDTVNMYVSPLEWGRVASDSVRLREFMFYPFKSELVTGPVIPPEVASYSPTVSNLVHMGVPIVPLTNDSQVEAAAWVDSHYSVPYFVWHAPIPHPIELVPKDATVRVLHPLMVGDEQQELIRTHARYRPYMLGGRVVLVPSAHASELGVQNISFSGTPDKFIFAFRPVKKINGVYIYTTETTVTFSSTTPLELL